MYCNFEYSRFQEDYVAKIHIFFYYTLDSSISKYNWKKIEIHSYPSGADTTEIHDDDGVL